MENEKNNSGYNNESYLDKRTDPVDGVENLSPKEENPVNSLKERDEIEKIEDNQKEMTSEIKKKRNKDFTKPLILGVVVLIVIGVLAIIYLIPLINIQKKESPQQIIKSAMSEMQKVKTYSYDGIIEFDVENKETYENFNFNIELSGKDDITDLNNIKSSSNLKIVADVDMDGGSQEFSFDLDAMQFGQKKIYLKVNDFDLGMLGMMIGPEINSFKGNWYKLDLEELERLQLEELNAASPGSVSNTSMTNSMMTYDLNKIMALYNKYELLKFQEDLGDVKLGDIDVYHYKVKLDGIALANFYVEVMKEMMSEIDLGDEDGTFSEEFSKTFEEIGENIKKYDYVINKITDNVNIEVWIGKDDKLIYRTKIDGEFDKEFIEMIEDEMIDKESFSDDGFDHETTEDDFEIAFYVDIKMSDFNQPVEITEPEEAENLMEVLEGMSEEFMGPGPGGAMGGETDTDGDGLPDYIETIYGSDPNNPDTDGDGYTDGEEVDGGYDPVIPGDARLDYDKLFKT